MKSLNVTFGSILAFVAVATLPYLGRVQYAPRIGVEVPIVALLVIAAMWGSVKLLKSGGALKAARVIGFVLAGLLGFFAFIVGLLLTGQRAIQTEPLTVGLICVALEAIGSALLFRGAFRNPPLAARAAKRAKVIIGSVLFLMSLASALGMYEAMTLGRTPLFDRALIFGSFALLEVGASITVFISAFKKRPYVLSVGLKRCPQCDRAYDDAAQDFCLDDGAILVNPSDPNATLVDPPRFVV